LAGGNSTADNVLLGLQYQIGRMADAKVRQSLVLLLDQDYLIKQVYKGFALRSQGPLPPALEKESGADTYRLIMR